MSAGHHFIFLTVNGYIYRQNNLTNEFLDLKLAAKEVLVEIFEQIFQCIFFNMSFGGHF